VNIPFSKSLEVHPFLHAFPRQNASENDFLEMVCKVFFFFSKPRRKVDGKGNRAADFPGSFLLLGTALGSADLPFRLCPAQEEGGESWGQEGRGEGALVPERDVSGAVGTTLPRSAALKLSVAGDAAPFLCSILALTFFNATAESRDI